MNTTQVVKYIEENYNSFEYKILKNVSLNESDIVKEVNNSKLLTLMKSTDGVVSHVIHEDNINQNEKIDNSKNSKDFIIHTDGPYYKNVPEIVGLYCIDEGKKQAITYISDSNKAIESLLPQEIEVLENLDYTYIGKDGILHPRKLIEVDPLTNQKITNISARGFISPSLKIGKDLPDLFTSSKIIKKLHKALDESIVYEHILEEGDLMLFNNNKYLHGRKGTIKDTKRHLLRLRFSTT